MTGGGRRRRRRRRAGAGARRRSSRAAVGAPRTASRQAAGDRTAEDVDSQDDRRGLRRPQGQVAGGRRRSATSASPRSAGSPIARSTGRDGARQPGRRLAHRRRRTKRARFVEVFKDVLAARYMDDIDRFQGTETVTVDGSAREGDVTVVHTTLVTASREHVPIDYRMRESRALDGRRHQHRGRQPRQPLPQDVLQRAGEHDHRPADRPPREAAAPDGVAAPSRPRSRYHLTVGSTTSLRLPDRHVQQSVSRPARRAVGRPRRVWSDARRILPFGPGRGRTPVRSR